jgi:hypothetical protein
MSTTSTRRRAALAGLLAAAAIGSAAGPAQAHAHPRPVTPIDCQAGLERLETTFGLIEARFGYELATRWWNDIAWPAFYRRCPNTI